MTSRFYDGPKALHRIDVVDDLFRKHSGMLAPGKDYPISSSPPPSPERREAWERWHQSGDAWFCAIERITVLEDELERTKQDLEDEKAKPRDVCATCGEVDKHDDDCPELNPGLS
jgi:hypothetical protein